MKGGKPIFRTNLTILSVGAAMTLTCSFVVAYGDIRVLRPDSPLYGNPVWPVLILSLGIGGILLLLGRGGDIPLVATRLLGVLALLPLALGVVVTASLASATALAVLVPSLAAAGFAVLKSEADPKDSTHYLHDVLVGSVLLLFGILRFLLPPARPLPFEPAAQAGAALVGAFVLSACLRLPASRTAAAARATGGLALLGLAAASATITRQPALGVFLAPMGLIALLAPWLRPFGAASPDDPGLTEENRVVFRFQKVTELVAWSIYAFALFHSYFSPPATGHGLMFLFTLAFIAFVYLYELAPASEATYASFHRSSIVNVALLAVVAHLTGGLLSPYAWFFVFIPISGSISVVPGFTLRRLNLILAYYAAETAYFWWIGALNRQVIINHLMLQVFVIGLTGIYAYRLSERRREVDAELRATNDGLKRAVAREQEARKEADRQAAEIERAKQRDEAIMASLADGVVVVDASGKVSFMNLAAERFTGLSRQEGEGKPLKDALKLRVGEAAADLEPLLKAVLGGNAVPLPEDATVIGEDGRKIDIDGAAVPVFGADGKANAAVFALRDVTYLREVDQMKTSFLSVAAHQLRTPLSTIRWYLELLNDPEEGRLKKNQKLFAENAYESLRKMISLVNRLLAVTRLEAGRVPVKPAPTHLGRLTREIVSDLGIKLKERKIDVHVNAPEDLPEVPLDPTLSREVFVNLVENAIRYTPDGGSIVIEVQDVGEVLRWTIQDTGIGIPKDQQAKIFEKFFRASNAVTHDAAGSGLGLYLAKFIVGTWNGEIGFESAEGKGTTFWVTVPKAGMKAKAGEVSLNA